MHSVNFHSALTLVSSRLNFTANFLREHAENGRAPNDSVGFDKFAFFSQYVAVSLKWCKI